MDTIRTKLSDVDGEGGRLVIAGYDVDRLPGTFEDVWALLNGGERPDFGPARAAAPRAGELMAGVAQLPSSSPVEVGAAVAALVGGKTADPKLTQAEDLLRMITGEVHPVKARALDTYLKTVSDHGMNASTFTCRVIASTGSDLVSAVTGAIGALKGPLHGGAPGPVLDMLDAIGDPTNATRWLAAELDAGRRIMGMGHRIYRVRDPRAAVLEREVERLEAEGIKTKRLALARAVESAAAELLAKRYPDRPLQANVEFYTAVLLDSLGIPRTLFTGLFAVGRTAGWCAHYAEQRATGRLIRPDSTYVGAGLAA